MYSELLVGLLVDRLTGWPVGWVTNPLTGWLVSFWSRLTYWAEGQPSWLANWMDGLLSGYSAGRLVSCPERTWTGSPVGPGC